MMNIRLFILIIYAIIVKIVANIGYLIFFVSVYFIIKYTANKQNAKLGMSPYIKVESIGIVKKVKVKTSINTLFTLYVFDN